MTWLTSILVSLLAGIAGLILAGFTADACTRWYHVSSRDGAAGYFVMFMALAGGIAGLILGLITARFVAAQYGGGFGKELGAALGVVLVVAGLSASLCRLLADVPPRMDGQKLILEVEFRFPNTVGTNRPPTAEGEWLFEFCSLSGHSPRKQTLGTIRKDAVRREGGRWIVPAEAELFTQRGKRSVSLARREATETVGFTLPLPARPGREYLEWSEWLPHQQADGQPWPADRMSCRFRIQKEVPPPPPPSAADFTATVASKKEAEFLAIPADAPVERWFPYLTHLQPQTERARQIVAQRKDLAAELGRLALGEDAELAGAALRCIEALPTPQADLINPVRQAGRDLAERMRKVNALTPEQDPSYFAAADVSIRFSGWMCAARALREKCNGDFVPELKPLLELSRVRQDSHVMQMSVCRVASFYLQEWAGIAPLPTDPKPR